MGLGAGNKGRGRAKENKEPIRKRMGNVHRQKGQRGVLKKSQVQERRPGEYDGDGRGKKQSGGTTIVAKRGEATVPQMPKKTTRETLAKVLRTEMKDQTALRDSEPFTAKDLFSTKREREW